MFSSESSEVEPRSHLQLAPARDQSERESVCLGEEIEAPIANLKNGFDTGRLCYEIHKHITFAAYAALDLLEKLFRRQLVLSCCQS